ncbi:MAG TPA: prenyltransferase, partial [Novosphingobium capsulatum]|nr:prenyltransferase [Novosphingobium capsulatum]
MPDPDSSASPSAPPLVVDLDGTLIRGDLAMEAMIVVARRGLGPLLALLAMLLRGRGALKTWLARV